MAVKLRLQEYLKRRRLRAVASGIGPEDLDEVVAKVAVNDSRAAGTKYYVLEAAVHIDVVADVGLGVEVVSGLRRDARGRSIPTEHRSRWLLQ